jgi:hypothetical protein
MTDTNPRKVAAHPANDNKVTRGRTTWPLQELYNRGELGVNETENRARWAAVQRFKRQHDAVKGDRIDDGVAADWRELMLIMTETDEAVAMSPIGENDGPSVAG